jgi:hypothetical protein
MRTGLRCSALTCMRKQISIRLLILLLSLSVFVLGTEAVSHSHGLTHDEDHCTCQVCHVGHAAISQPTVQAQLIAPLLVARFAPAEALLSLQESVDSTSVPRAPPEPSRPA